MSSLLIRIILALKISLYLKSGTPPLFKKKVTALGFGVQV